MSDKQPKSYEKLAGALFLIALLQLLAVVWYWALRGMSQDVVAAHTVTIGVIVFLGFALLDLDDL